MVLTLQDLQALVQADLTERDQARNETAVNATNNQQQHDYSFRQVIQNVCNDKELMHSSFLLLLADNLYAVDPSLFRVNVSKPSTTLVEYKDLPRSVRNQILQDDLPNIQEVPLKLLYDDPEKLPFSTTLTHKLQEYYTRGAMNPHSVGRIKKSTQTISTTADEEKEVLFADGDAQQQRRHALQVVDRVTTTGSSSSSIQEQPDFTTCSNLVPIFREMGITIPQQQEGITWEDVLPSSNVNGPEKQDVAALSLSSTPYKEEEVPIQTEHDPSLDEFVSSTESSSRVTIDFTAQNFLLEDDSLFGSSSSDDDDDQYSEGTDSEDDNNLPEDNNDFPRETGTVEVHSEEMKTGVEDEVDGLLQELNLSTESSAIVRKSQVVSTNPLAMAEERSKFESDVHRKSWAVTKLLPIRDFDSLIPNPALKYPFTLDSFQQQAIARLERSEACFVAAHTSAGKTVVAEYAIALAMRHGTRCIYTSPIKSLSNQKLRDFSQKFGAKNVGLITGDLQVNADDATCIIMTTEILRSMLYRSAPLLRDVESVVFDEVHYINNSERGVVWEETIIMLPSTVNLIFLSATTPNTIEFSDWVGRTKKRPVHVIKTDYRPVPLSFHLWAGLKLHKVLEGNSGFLEKGYNDAAKALKPKENKKDPKSKLSGRSATGSKLMAWQAQGTKQNWMSLVRFLDREFLTPAVVFSFSKKKCVEIANMLQSLDLNTAKERSAVQGFALQTVARLSEVDSQLPQVKTVCEMVQRGIGIHHGGLLPILKEMVEILFQKNLIKVLFATETFAMGVNMPARAVVFNSIRKHDGNQFRVLESGEFTQMAGRAGRRGLDDVGTVIICCFGEEPPPNQILRQVLTGSSTKLSSQFRLTYNMILNLLRVEDLSVESMIKRSFSEFATQRALTSKEYPQLLEKGKRMLAKIESRLDPDSPARAGLGDLALYFSLSSKVLKANSTILSYLQREEVDSFEELLCPGRVILLSSARRHGVVRAPALILRTPERTRSSMAASSQKKANDRILCMTLLPESFIQKDEDTSDAKYMEVGFVGAYSDRFFSIIEVSPGELEIFAFTHEKIPNASSLIKAGTGNSSRSIDPRFAAADPFAGMKARKSKQSDTHGIGTVNETRTVDEVMKKLIAIEKAEVENIGFPFIDLQTFVNRSLDIREICSLATESLAEARSQKAHSHPLLEKFYTELERISTLKERVKVLEHLLSNESLQLFPDFLQRKAVLLKLSYLNRFEETISVKGRVACETNTADELIVTEMIFEGLLNEMEPQEIAAVLSSLVFQEKSGSSELDSEVPLRIVECCDKMKAIAVKLGQVQKDYGLNVDPVEYCNEALKFGLVHVVYEWAIGVSFKNICELTDVPEGSIVRCITRLDELCREMRNCSRIVGNPTLYRKLEAASCLIKRDIVFASSLYVS